MIKVLGIIYNNEKKLKMLFLKYNLKYQMMVLGKGTASNSILTYFGLEKLEKKIYFTVISDEIENKLLPDLKRWCKLPDIGVGIAFTISLNGLSKFIVDDIGEGDKYMKNKNDFDLVVTIVNDGYSDMVMSAAYKEGCSGGTVIDGRSLGSRRTIFMDLTIEPEKELVLTIVKKDIKENVMKRITKECGVKTDARGILFSIPLDNVIGIKE